MTEQIRSIRLAGATLNCPCHVCAFFASKEEEDRILLPFMAEGIDAGDECINILDAARRGERIASLAKAGIDVAAAESRGQLELRPWEEAHVVGGRFDQDAMLARLESEAASSRDRHGVTRLWSNQEWARDELPGVEDLVEYEARFNFIWPNTKDVFVCVYDTTKFRADLLMQILRAHPLTIIGGILAKNPFYVPPEELLQEIRGRSALQRPAAPPGPDLRTHVIETMEAGLGRIPPHMHATVRAYVLTGVLDNDFLAAVLTFDMNGAVLHADAANRTAIADWASFIIHDLPARCRGSVSNVNAWVRGGGLDGRGAAGGPP